MRIRPYIESKDFDEISKWITEERTHALWCANLIQFPIEKENFGKVMQETAEDLIEIIREHGNEVNIVAI